MGAIAIGRPALPGASVNWGDRLNALIKGGLILLSTAFTNAGAGIITGRVVQTGTAPKYIGWGTGTNAASLTDTTLQTEVAPTTAGGRTASTESRTTITNTNDNLQYQGIVIATAGESITEAGCFDAATAGNLLLRSVFGVITVVIGDAIQFTFGLKLIPGIT